MLVRKKH